VEDGNREFPRCSTWQCWRESEFVSLDALTMRVAAIFGLHDSNKSLLSFQPDSHNQTRTRRGQLDCPSFVMIQARSSS
jgi:hypothetical protein